MSRFAKTLELAGTVIYKASASSAANQISVTIQNPPSNSGNVEIAWDDVDAQFVTGQNIILAPGDIKTFGGLPVNANGNIGVLGLTVTSPPLAVRVVITSPTTP